MHVNGYELLFNELHLQSKWISVLHAVSEHVDKDTQSCVLNLDLFPE